MHWKNKHLRLIFPKVKIKYSKKKCVQDNVVVVFNANTWKYFNYGKSDNGSTIGFVCVHCYDSKDLNILDNEKV